MSSTAFRDHCEVAVVGAGPYGLSLGAHLNSVGIETRVLGKPMSFWRDNMPKGMKLRSPWAASHIADPDNLLSLDAYAAVSCLGRPDPLPVEYFVRYGEWFWKSALPDLDTRRVITVAPAPRGFTLALEDGGALHARRVVIAMGLANQQYIPPEFEGLPSHIASHAADHADLSRFAGQRIAVIGRGQSACESSALLHEAGAEVTQICRADVHWLGAQTSGNAHRRDLYWHLHKLLATKSGVGPFPLNWINEQPNMIHELPRGWRAWLNANSLRAGAAGWVRPRVRSVQIDAGRTVVGARVRGTGIELELDNGRFDFDHVLLATGYRIDITRLGIFSADFAQEIDTDDGSPVLENGYESNVPGLHFVGSSAVRSYGPLLRFVWGAGYAARNVTRFICANRLRPTFGRDACDEAELYARRTETASRLS